MKILNKTAIAAALAVTASTASYAEQVNIGDIVLTSDLSSYFPPNLPVGEVVSIYDKSDSFNKIVRLELYADLSTINQLFIIIDEDRK